MTGAGMTEPGTSEPGLMQLKDTSNNSSFPVTLAKAGGKRESSFLSPPRNLSQDLLRVLLLALNVHWEHHHGKRNFGGNIR